jgi:protein SCO1/2
VTGARRHPGGLVALVLLAALGVAGALVARHSHGDAADTPVADTRASDGRDHGRAADGTLPRLWHVPAFAFTDQTGHPLSDTALRGAPFIADFIFTRCTSTCPLLSARLVLLEHAIADRRVRFVSFSVDPEHDTPAALAAYARRWHGDQTRWQLVATTPAGLRALAAGMKATVQATGDAADPLLHSNRFQLVDGDGFVRGVYDSSDDADMAVLAADAARLAGATRASSAPAAPLPRDGAQLFSALGCAGCHAAGAMARPLGGLYGTRVALEDGSSVVADAAYLKESIVDPTAKLVAGYPPSMPSYRATLDPPRLGALVRYLESLPGDGAAPAARRRAVDPVCKMAISVDAHAPHLERGGTTYYFCSEKCRDRFRTQVIASLPPQ